MKSNRKRQTDIRASKIIVMIIVLLIALFLGGIFLVRQTYQQNLGAASSSEEYTLFTVDEGATASEIADKLKQAGLIKSSWAFEWYIRTKGLRQFIKAGTYNLRPSMTVPQIADLLTEGRIATDLVTILPNQNLGQISDALVNKYGFDPAAVKAALNPDNYPNHPALVDKPTGASLEGYLYPESFQKTAETTPEDVILSSLDEMQKHLTPEIRNGIVVQGLTVHQGIILASIVENEVSNPNDKRMVAQVFYRRLREGMLLRSDAAPYTYSNAGLPPEPISNVTSSSLAAVASPASTDFLYFVSGDDGQTHFSHTFEEHESLIKQYCKTLCQQM